MEKTVYDYIIVGAGSAGCLLAKRLAEAGHPVLLLEAGEDIEEEKNANVHDPQRYGAAFATSLNWGFATVEQPECNNRHIRCTRGKGVGGTSLINGMLYNRGDPSIYDEWGQENPGWSYQDCLAYFKKHEDFVQGESHYHGAGGEHRVNNLPKGRISPVAYAYIKAGQEAGHTHNHDQNGENQTGVGLMQVSIKDNGRRVTAVQAFLNQNTRDRLPITLISKTLVQSVLFDSDLNSKRKPTRSPQAVGVAYIDLTDGSNPNNIKRGANLNNHQQVYDVSTEILVHAFARKEVILCAGAIGTPQVLMLSGIGPKHVLNRHNIKPLVCNEGVGANLVDHPRVAVRWESHAAVDVSQFFSHVEGCLYTRSDIATRALVAAQMRNSSSPSSSSSPFPSLPQTEGIAASVCDIQIQQDHVRTNDDLLRTPPISTGFNLKPHVARPFSRGWVRLRSTNPRSKPLINPNYLKDPRDISILLQGIKVARHVVSMPAFSAFRGEELQPGKQIQNDDNLVGWIRANVDTGYHPVGSCRMGPNERFTLSSSSSENKDENDGLFWQSAYDAKDQDNDGNSLKECVVSNTLNVYGVKRLRVVDASIMPSIPNSNTNAATLMIAEKGAAMLLKDAKSLPNLSIRTHSLRPISKL